MITSKDDLRRYLEMDAKALGVNPRQPFLIGKEVWKFEKSLRKYEYYLNCSNNWFARFVWHTIYHYWTIKLGLIIPPNVAGGGT